MENETPQPPVALGNQDGPGEEVSLNQIMKECMDASGYVIFVGRLTNKRDDLGFNLIDFKYRRYHFSFEDTKKSIEEFAKAFSRDVSAI